MGGSSASPDPANPQDILSRLFFFFSFFLFLPRNKLKTHFPGSCSRKSVPRLPRKRTRGHGDSASQNIPQRGMSRNARPVSEGADGGHAMRRPSHLEHRPGRLQGRSSAVSLRTDSKAFNTGLKPSHSSIPHLKRSELEKVAVVQSFLHFQDGKMCNSQFSLCFGIPGRDQRC